MHVRTPRMASTRLGAPIRIALARRPWIRWSAIALLATGLGVSVTDRLSAVDRARASWTDTVEVYRARVDHVAGDPIVVEPIRLPRAGVPATAITALTPATTARQRIAVGEIVVDNDVTVASGPAARAAPGTVVVPVADQLVVSAPTGARVAVYAEGVVLAASGHVVDRDGDVLFIAVDAADGPIVAAAAQSRTASIVFLT